LVTNAHESRLAAIPFLASSVFAWSVGGQFDALLGLQL
jgi:hypothetical protein